MPRPSTNQIIVMKKGDTLRGQIQEKTVDIDTDYGVCRVPVAKISRIGFKDAYIGDADFIETKDLEKYTGRIVNARISIRTFSDNQVKNLDTRKILMIICSIL